LAKEKIIWEGFIGDFWIFKVISFQELGFFNTWMGALGLFGRKEELLKEKWGGTIGLVFQRRSEKIIPKRPPLLPH